MPPCPENDLAALKESGPLLRFAAERVKNLDPDLSLAIAEAHAAAEAGQWTPQVSQRFWTAFSKLCDLIQPVTMDCLTAAHPNIDPPRWRRFFGSEKVSVAERSSTRYLTVLFVLLILVLPIQLYVWTVTNLSKKIDDLLAAEKPKYAALVQDYTKLFAESRGLTGEAKWTAEQNIRLDKLIVDAKSVHDDLDKIDAERNLLEAISLFRRSSLSEFQGRAASGAPWYAQYESAAIHMSATQISIQPVQEKANLIAGVLAGFILPIMFGAIGAVAYVIRSISDLIRTSTFASNSPIRHVMRAALGAMVGLVVGLFGDLSTKLSLSPLAIAFLAGYGVEAVFSMFDGIIDRFKPARTTA